MQYHNQPAESPLHQRLVEMWAAVRNETGGRVETQVFPENNKIPGSDPAALKMLVAGEIQFFTLMGGILGNVVPVAEVQQVPFAFRSAAHAHQAVDGPLGAYLRRGNGGEGDPRLPRRRLRQRDAPDRRHERGRFVAPDDLVGMRMRIPAGQMFDDTFRALGAEPVTVNSSGIYEALKRAGGRAGEPARLHGLFSIYEVMKYVSMTNHMWSGFNMLAHLPTWNRLPADIQAAIERNVAKYVRLQRQDQEAVNASRAQRSRAAACRSTTWSPRRSESSWPASTRAGRRRSARSAGRCSRARELSVEDVNADSNAESQPRRRRALLARRRTLNFELDLRRRAQPAIPSSTAQPRYPPFDGPEASAAA